MQHTKHLQTIPHILSSLTDTGEEAGEAPLPNTKSDASFDFTLQVPHASPGPAALPSLVICFLISVAEPEVWDRHP